VVRGKHDARRLNDTYAEGALNGAYLCGERLEPAQSTARLRQSIQPPVGFGANGLVDRGR
jgi:hypothetical protein